MIEQIMYLAIGFLSAIMLALMIAPLVHNRAVRLTTKRLEAATPLSMAEIQADKDQLRAEFAMSARRLEMSVEQLKNKTTSQFAEIGKKADAINRLKLELAEKNAAIFTLEAREKALNEQLRATEEQFAARTQDLRSAEAALAEKQAELARINSDLADRSSLADTRQIELIAVRAQIDELTARVGDAEKEFSATQTRLDSQRGESAAASRDLEEARGKVESLSQRVTELDRQLLGQVKEAEQLGGRVQELQDRLAAREAEIEQLRAANRTAEDTIRQLRSDVAAASGTSPDFARLREDRAALEQQLRQAQDERGKAQRELTAIQQQAETAWATERMENALLRERINDIAAEVAKLAMTLEGPDSPIQGMLTAPLEPTAQLAAKIANGANTADTAAGPAVAGGTLAERIRALQSHATRARQAG